MTGNNSARSTKVGQRGKLVLWFVTLVSCISQNWIPAVVVLLAYYVIERRQAQRMNK